jgi:hypothetical protein
MATKKLTAYGSYYPLVAHVVPSTQPVLSPFLYQNPPKGSHIYSFSGKNAAVFGYYLPVFGKFTANGNKFTADGLTAKLKRYRMGQQKGYGYHKLNVDGSAVFVDGFYRE